MHSNDDHLFIQDTSLRIGSWVWKRMGGGIRCSNIICCQYNWHQADTHDCAVSFPDLYSNLTSANNLKERECMIMTERRHTVRRMIMFSALILPYIARILVGVQPNYSMQPKNLGVRVLSGPGCSRPNIALAQMQNPAWVLHTRSVLAICFSEMHIWIHPRINLHTILINFATDQSLFWPNMFFMTCLCHNLYFCFVAIEGVGLGRTGTSGTSDGLTEKVQSKLNEASL